MSASVAIALGLAKYIPEVMRLFGKEDSAEVADRVLGVASAVTGIKDPSKAAEAIKQSPELQIKLKKLTMEDKWMQERIDLDNVKDARNMYAANHAAADQIGKHVIKFNLPLALALFFGNIIALYFFRDHSELLLILGNMTGFLLNSLLKERQDIINFYFGSSLGSKIKELKANITPKTLD
jgi:hypothetical protein